MRKSHLRDIVRYRRKASAGARRSGARGWGPAVRGAVPAAAAAVGAEEAGRVGIAAAPGGRGACRNGPAAAPARRGGAGPAQSRGGAARAGRAGRRAAVAERRAAPGGDGRGAALGPTARSRGPGARPRRGMPRIRAARRPSRPTRIGPADRSDAPAPDAARPRLSRICPLARTGWPWPPETRIMHKSRPGPSPPAFFRSWPCGAARTATGRGRTMRRPPLSQLGVWTHGSVSRRSRCPVGR